MRRLIFNKVLFTTITLLVVLTFSIDTFQGALGVPHEYDEFKIFFIDIIDDVVRGSGLGSYLWEDYNGYKAPFYRLIAYVGFVLSGEINLKIVTVFFSFFWIGSFLYLCRLVLFTNYELRYSLPVILMAGVWTSLMAWTGVAYYTYIVILPFFIFFFLSKQKYLLTFGLALFYVLNVPSSPILLLVIGLYFALGIRNGDITVKKFVLANFTLIVLFLVFLSIKSESSGFITFNILHIIQSVIQFAGAAMIYFLPADFRSSLLLPVAFWSGILLLSFSGLILFINRSKLRDNMTFLYVFILFILNGVLISTMRSTAVTYRYEYLYFGLLISLYLLLISVSTGWVRNIVFIAFFLLSLGSFAIRYYKHNTYLPILEMSYNGSVMYAISGGHSFKFNRSGQHAQDRSTQIENYLLYAVRNNLYKTTEAFKRVNSSIKILPSDLKSKTSLDSLNNFQFFDGRMYTFIVIPTENIVSVNAKDRLFVQIKDKESQIPCLLHYELHKVRGDYISVINESDLDVGEYKVDILRLFDQNGVIIETDRRIIVEGS